MRFCEHCHTEVYDTELYCPECGKAMADPLNCAYCKAPVTNVEATHCGNCGGLLIFDRYPEHMGTIFCHVCGKKKPANSNYCTACGSPDREYDVPINDYYENTANQQKKTNKNMNIVLAIVIWSFIIPFIIIVISFILVGVSSDSHEYDDHTYSTEQYDPPPDDVDDYFAVNLDELHEHIYDIKPGDYLALIGTISEKSDYNCKLIPSVLTIENKDSQVSINWLDDISNTGERINDYYRIGDYIVVTCRVTNVYGNINTIHADGLSIVEYTEYDIDKKGY